MQQKPLFSVLIANHNDGQYLQDTIESIFNQTYENWEVIIVDDKSSDNSFDIYNKYQKDSRIRIFLNKTNRGCGYTKKRCVEKAHGEICGFVDADDCLAQYAIEKMVSLHQKNPKCSLIYSKFYYTDNLLNIISTSTHQCKIPSGLSFLTCDIPGAISHFATFKRSKYEETIGIDENMPRAIDIDLYLKLEEIGDTLFFDEPLYYYRCNTGNNTSLGESNARKALYWNYYCRINACNRRNLAAEEIVFPSIEKNHDEENREWYRIGAEKVRDSLAYKIGKKLLTPFIWIKE